MGLRLPWARSSERIASLIHRETDPGQRVGQSLESASDRRHSPRGGAPLLLYLARNRDRVATKGELIEAVWGGCPVSDSALVRCASSLARSPVAAALSSPCTDGALAGRGRLREKRRFDDGVRVAVAPKGQENRDGTCYSLRVDAVKAKEIDGRIAIGEQTDLPEGTSSISRRGARFGWHEETRANGR